MEGERTGWVLTWLGLGLGIKTGGIQPDVKVPTSLSKREDVLSPWLLQEPLQSGQAVWRENDVAQDRPPSTTKHYWVTDTDTSLLKPAPVQRQESNNIKRSLCSPNWSLSVPATAVTFSMEWEKPFYKLYFLTQRKLSSCLVKQMPWKRGLVHAALCNFGIFFFPWRALPWRLQVTGVGVPLAQRTPPTGSVCTLPEGLWSRTGQPQ